MTAGLKLVEQSRARAWALLLLCSGSAVLSYTDRQVLTLLVDPIRTDLQITDTQFGLLQGAAFGFVYGISGVALGRFADLHSRLGILRAGVLVWSVASICCALAHSFGGIFLSRMFVGVGEATLMPAVISLIPDLFPPARRGTATGIFLTSLSIGAGVALVLGGIIQGAAQKGLFAFVPFVGNLPPWRLTIVLLGLAGAPFLAGLWVAREPSRRDNREKDAVAIGAEASSSSLYMLWQARRIIVSLLIALAFANAGDFAVMGWSPTVLSRLYGWSTEVIGEVVGTTIIVASVAGVMAGGVLSDLLRSRFDVQSRVMIAFTASILSVAGASVAFASTGGQVIALAACWVVTSSAANVAGITTLQEVSPAGSRATVASLVALCNVAFGFTLGNVGPGFVADNIFHSANSIGAGLTLVAMPSAVLAAILYWWVLVQLKRSK